MKCKSCLLIFLLLPVAAAAQFEQKLSLNLSGGMFTTFGSRTWMPDWGSMDEDREPSQIANFRPGYALSAGIQYNLNRHISLQLNGGVMFTDRWYYNDYEDHNYTEWAIWHPDELIDTLMAEGNNELSLKNIGFGLIPRYYLLPGKRVNPFVFLGLTVNHTSTTFEDNEWEAFRDLGMLDPDDSGPEGPYMGKNTGVGIHPGAGMEISLHDNVSFHLVAGYYFVFLQEKSFYVPEQHEHLHAVVLQAGISLSFLKSRNM